jgi:hypothetical protein
LFGWQWEWVEKFSIATSSHAVGWIWLLVPRVISLHQDRSSYRAKREKGIIRILKNRRELFSVQHTHTLFLLHDKKPSLISHTLLLPPPPPSKKKTLILYIVRFADENARCRPWEKI